jgi:hypothetical protein
MFSIAAERTCSLFPFPRCDGRLRCISPVFFFGFLKVDFLDFYLERLRTGDTSLFQSLHHVATGQ